MANLIQIKRANTATAPASLSQGELAYTANGGVLFIGDPSTSSVTAIGGVRNPGTLTANQALVANSTSGIDRVITGNLTVRSITANGVYSPGAGYLLSVDAGGNTYWLPQTAVSINTNSVFTWGNTHTFNGNVSIAGANLYVTATNTTIAGSNSTITSNVSITGANLYISSANTNITGNANFGGTLTLNPAGFSAPAWTNNGISLIQSPASYTDTTSSGAVTSVFINKIGAATINATSVTTYGSAYGTYFVAPTNGTNVTITNPYAVGADSLYVFGSVILAATQSVSIGTSQTTAAITVGGGGGATGSLTIGRSTANQAVNIASGATVSGNIKTIGIGENGVAGSQTNITIGSSLSNTQVIVNANNSLFSGIVNAASHTVGTAFVANTTTLSAVSNALFVNSTAAVFTSGVTTVNAISANVYAQNLTVSGNLVVSGTVMTVNTQTLAVNDNIIELGLNNITTDAVDTGWFSPAGNSTSIWYSGLARIAAKSSNTNPWFWVFGSNTNPNTATTIDQSANSTTGTIQAYLVPYGSQSGAFVVNAQSVAITANSTVNVNITANTLTLSTGLSATSGGTGRTTGFTAGDLLYASNTTYMSNLAIGTTGQVLQVSSGNLPSWGTLDGGTF